MLLYNWLKIFIFKYSFNCIIIYGIPYRILGTLKNLSFNETCTIVIILWDWNVTRVYEKKVIYLFLNQGNEARIKSTSP